MLKGFLRRWLLKPQHPSDGAEGIRLAEAMKEPLRALVIAADDEVVNSTILQFPDLLMIKLEDWLKQGCFDAESVQASPLPADVEIKAWQTLLSDAESSRAFDERRRARIVHFLGTMRSLQVGAFNSRDSLPIEAILAALKTPPGRFVPKVLRVHLRRMARTHTAAVADPNPKTLDAEFEAWQSLLNSPDFFRSDLELRLETINSGAARHLERFEAFEQEPDLRRAFDFCKYVLENGPQDGQAYSIALINMAAVSIRCFSHYRDDNYLEYAIRTGYEAAARRNLDDEMLAQARMNLSESLLLRYRRNGDQSDLESAIAAGNAALFFSKFSSPNLIRRLAGTANALQYSRDPVYFKQAIRLCSLAVQCASPGRIERRIAAAALGQMLVMQARETRIRDDIEKAIEALRISLDSANLAPRMQGRFELLLGDALIIRYTITRDRADLLAAQQPLIGAMKHIPDADAAYPLLRLTFGTMFTHIYDLDGEARDLAMADLEFDEAARKGLAADPNLTLEVARRWGSWSERHDRWHEASSAYRYALEAIDKVFQLQLLWRGRTAFLSKVQGYAGRASYAAAMAGDAEAAVEIIEQGSAIQLADALERNTLDEEGLKAAGRNDLVVRYRAIVEQIRPFHFEEWEMGQLRTVFGYQPVDFRAAFHEIEKLIKEIRTVPGCERFLKPLRYDDIRAIAGTVPGCSYNMM